MGFNEEMVFEKTDMEKALQEIEAIFKNSFGEEFVCDAASPQGQLIREMAKHLVREEEKITELLSALNVDNLQGLALDYQAEYKGLKRDAASPCIFDVEVVIDAAKDPGKRLDIKAGEEMERVGDGLECIALEGGQSDENGRLRVKVRSKETGEIKVGVGEDFELKSPNNDVVSIKSVSEGKGKNRESDLQLKRRYQSLQFQARDKDAFIRSELLACAEHVRLVNNKSLADVEGVPSGHFEATAYLVYDEAAFANRLFQLLDVATPTFGNKSFNIVDSSGVAQTLRYSLAEEVFVKLELVFAQKGGVVSPTKEAKSIKEKIMNYYAGKKERIGANIYASDIVGLLQDEDLFIGDMKLYKEGEPASSSYELLVGSRQIALFKEENILVSGVSS